MNLLLVKEPNIFESLYDKYSKEIYMICFSYCQNKADAEDCLQEVFCRAMSKASEVKKHPAPDKWLYIAARLVSLEKLRANNKRNRDELDISDFEAILESGAFEDGLLERRYADAEIILLRNDILGKLNKKEQELYSMRYIEKLGVDNIAERLGISYSSATTRLNRLKMRILKSVEKLFRD